MKEAGMRLENHEPRASILSLKCCKEAYLAQKPASNQFGRRIF